MFLRSGGAKASTFAGIHHSTAVFSICYPTKFTTGRVKRGVFSARWAEAFIYKTGCVQLSMLQSKTFSRAFSWL